MQDKPNHTHTTHTLTPRTLCTHSHTTHTLCTHTTHTLTPRTLCTHPHTIQLRDVRDLVVEKEKGQDDQELLFEETSSDLKKLIVYCRSISIKPWSWRKQKATSVSEMFSFGEPLAIKLCDRSQRGGWSLHFITNLSLGRMVIGLMYNGNKQVWPCM